MMSPGALRSFIIGTVGQLKSALTTGSQLDPNVQVDNLMPDSGQDNLRHASPFGLISAPPKGVAAFFLGLFGSRFEKIALGFLDFKRPSPSGPGEAVLYSTTADGQSVQVKVTLGADGTLTIIAPTKVSVQAPLIALGSSGEHVINGETFIQDFLMHQHTGNMGAPTSAPTNVQTSDAYLSKSVTAEK